MEAALWIGPAIVAAIIAGMINVVGWFVTFRHARHLERERRTERIVDYQTALLAEIAGNCAQFAGFDFEAHAADVRARVLDDAGFTPFVPRDASSVVFEAVLKDIHVLPSETIEPVIAYYKQVMRVAYIVSDLKTENYSRLTQNRKFEIYIDYLGMIKQALRQAAEAERILRRSLTRGGGQASSPGADPASQRRSASAAASTQTSSKSPLDDI